MRRITFIIAMAGIFALFYLLAFSAPVAVESPSDLAVLEDNAKVSTAGRVVSERTIYENTKLIKLDNSIEILCDSCESYQNKTISVLGLTSRYENKTEIKALRIKEK